MSKKVEPLTGMWADLRQKAGPLWSSCEVELQELMRQIDIMVQNKKLEWERERQGLQARLEVREQEYIMQKSTLDQKHQEVGQLRQQIDTMERGQRDIAGEYEKQLKGLRDEVLKMRKEYEKLQKRYSKHNKEVQRDKLKTSGELEEAQSEVQRLSVKLDEFRQKSREWEVHRKSYEKQIDSLESQRKTLVEKCDLIQQQTVAYQSQVDKRKDMLDSTEISLRSRITQLEGQLDRARDTVNSQDTQISRLKTSLEDLMAAQRRTLEEKEKCETQLLKTSSLIKKLEEELGSSNMDVETKSSQLKITENNYQQLSSDLSQLKQSLVERDSMIQTLEQVNLKEQAQQLKKIQEDLKVSKEELKKCKKNERHLQEENRTYQEKLDRSERECDHLQEELSNKLYQIYQSEDNQLKNLTFHRNEVEETKQCHLAEISKLKTELSTTRKELQHRHLAVASLSERLAAMEMDLREQNETLERKTAAIQVSHAQLDALRLENRHLRKTALRQGDLEAAETEQHLQEIQNAYSSSVRTLELQNERLQGDVDNLRDRLHLVEDNNLQNRAQDILWESDRTLHHAKEDEQSAEFQQQIYEVRNLGDQKVAALQRQMDENVAKYEDRIKVLESEVSHLESQVESQHRSVQRLGIENEVMTSFVEGVDNIVRSPPKRDSSTVTSTGKPSSYSGSAEHTFDDDEEYFESVDVITSNFLAEQRQRAQELEQKLEKHIEGLKINTDLVLKKYNL